jgi:hypothetical protein
MLALGASLIAAPALADGDPASDVLAAQSVFLPQDANLSARQQAQLAALLQSSAQSGYPIRVALVASATDLGSVTALWRQPQSYARFLGQELSLVYRGPLLVVMPNGFGVYGTRKPVALSGVRPSDLGAAAIDAVLRVSSAAGHPLAAPAVAVPTASMGAEPGPWIAFGIGLLLVAIAWAASLRARPLRRPGEPVRGG